MRYSLKIKLSLSYALVALTLIASISILSNGYLINQFGQYMMKQHEIKANEIINLIMQQYDHSTKTWDVETIQNIGINALERGMIVRHKDIYDTTIWDATIYNNGLCKQMIAHMSDYMRSRYPNFKGGYEEKKYDLIDNGENIGSVIIGYYGPFYFTENDSAFIESLNDLLLGIAFVALIITLILGSLMARHISTPITKTIKAAEEISKGNYSDRIKNKSNTTEINNLINTTNNLAQTLENQDMLRKRLTSDVAHELRTPLSTLQSHMEAMIDGVWKPDKERLISCHEEIVRINRLVGDLEKLAKIESENLLLNKSKFDIIELIDKIIKNFEADFKNKNIEISYSGKSIYINADSDKISQVFVNLLSNALKYTPAGGKVFISAYSENNYLKVIVKDTGYGISKEDLPYIFERFYRADKSRNRITGGSGIGLTIVKAIIEAHKGSINVVSELNAGSEFIISIPLN